LPTKTLRVHTYIYFIDSDNLQTIKELLWQAILRSNKNFFKPPKTRLPLCSLSPQSLGALFFSEFQDI